MPPGWQRSPAAQVVPPQRQSPLLHVPAEPALQVASPLHAQAPLEQAKPVGQVRPQAPQFVALEFKFAQPASQQVSDPPQPLPPLQEQVLWPLLLMQRSPGRQTWSAPMRAHSQIPDSQDALPPALQSPFESHPQVLEPQAKPLTQPSPQLPQEDVLAETLVSQPSSAPLGGWAQLPKPTSQVELHTPRLQDLLRTLEAEHPRPQAPQFVVSVNVLVSHPSSAVGAEG